MFSFLFIQNTLNSFWYEYQEADIVMGHLWGFLPLHVSFLYDLHFSYFVHIFKVFSYAVWSKLPFLCFLKIILSNMYIFFFKYILLIMLLQLSPFFLPFIPLLPAPPPSTSIPPTLDHVHGSYIQVLWLVYFLYCS